MKIAVVTRFPEDPSAPRGGVEAVSVNLVQGLNELGGLEVHVVTTDRGCPHPSESEWQGVRVHRLEWTGRKILTHAMTAGRRRVQEFLRHLAPDVVHSHDVYGLMVKGLDMPRVFTIHGFIHGDTLVAGGRLAKLRAMLWRQIETAGWAAQPHIISISPYVRERLRGIARGVIHDIDNPISEEFFGLRRAEVPGRILSAAWISRRKNTLGLLRAFKTLQGMGIDAELRLAGAAHENSYLEAVHQYIREHGLSDSVRMLGKLDRHGILQELQHASVFVLVSLEENSPMAIEEAMAAGVPVVASNRCGMPYMVRDAESGFLVNPEDPNEVARSLARVLSDDALRAAMSAKSIEIAEDRYHPRRIAERTLQVYRRAIEDHERHREPAHV